MVKRFIGVDTDEQAVANAALELQVSMLHLTLDGLVKNYTDMHGVTRIKTETLVAGSSITSDADDDSQYAD